MNTIDVVSLKSTVLSFVHTDLLICTKICLKLFPKWLSSCVLLIKKATGCHAGSFRLKVDKKRSDQYWVSEAVPSTMSQGQIAVKNNRDKVAWKKVPFPREVFYEQCHHSFLKFQCICKVNLFLLEIRFLVWISKDSSSNFASNINRIFTSNINRNSIPPEMITKL